MEQKINVVLSAVVVAVAVVVALVLVVHTFKNGAGLDLGWGGFLAFVFGFVLRRVFPPESPAAPAAPESPAAPPAPGEGDLTT